MGSRRLAICGPVLIINQDAQCRAIGVVELPAPERPEKCRKAEQAEAERNGDEEEQPSQRAARFSRNALATTINDEPDIAAAAISGVTWPVIASGTAIRL